jgi:hypothetical protein
MNPFLHRSRTRTARPARSPWTATVLRSAKDGDAEPLAVHALVRPDPLHGAKVDPIGFR